MIGRLVVLSIISVALTLGYAVYVQPGWEAWRDDQHQYVLLAQGLALRGEYTRAPLGAPFVPEPLRTPGYPLLIAPLCATVGCDHWQIAVAQSLVSAVIPWLVFLLLVRRASPRFAFGCGAACAVYLPIAYYGALALADFAATVVMLLALWMASRADRIRVAIAAGTMCGLLALVRPQFVLFSLAVAATLLLAKERTTWRARLRPAVSLVVGAAIVLLPFNAYSARAFGGPAASSSGSGLWWGYFQGKTADGARVAEFRALALAGAPDDRIVSAGETAGLDPVESLQAAPALREIAAFNAIDPATDRLAQSYAWLDLNRSLAARALILIRHDPLGYLARGLSVRTIELWAGELPIRVDDFRALDPEWRALSAGVQLVPFVFAIFGAAMLVRRRGREELLVAACFLYTWLVLIAFITEPRYSLPARPAMIVAAATALVVLLRPRRT